MADILLLPPPPHRYAIPIHDPLDRIGRAYAEVDPSKVIGIVHTSEPDGGRPFDTPDEASRRIAEHVAEFFLQEMRSGRIPSEFLPLQSGVGNICNAVLTGLASCKGFPRFKVYTEVIQDAMLDMIASGEAIGASATALTLTSKKLAFLYENFGDFTDRIVLRPQEISNNPGIARQLGVIATNTAIEVDLYGHANSTHILGTQIVNGLGGSGDFERNAYLSVFMCPSTAKGGRISTIVPMCSHMDHSEHSVQVVVTEQGLADLRGLSQGPGPCVSSKTARTLPTGMRYIAISRQRRWGISATTCGTASTCIDHPGLVAEDAAAGNLASGVDRQYGNVMSLAGQHQAK